MYRHYFKICANIQTDQVTYRNTYVCMWKCNGNETEARNLKGNREYKRVFADNKGKRLML